MKKLISFIAICAASTSAFAAPHMVRRASNSYNVTYDYTDKAKTGWYVTGRAELSAWNFKNKYSSDYSGVYQEFDSDKYSFETVFGGSLAFGHQFSYFIRGDIEAGYMGSFSDKDDGYEYTLSIPYLMANAYYDFLNGFYIGAGVGLAMPTIELDGPFADTGNRKEREIGLAGGVNLGYTHKLDDNLVLDLRYRLLGITGVEQARRVNIDGNEYNAKVKTGFIMDNSISVGLRYEF